MPSYSNPSPRPRLACELAPDRIVAARANSDRTAVEANAMRRLAPGALVPGFANANIVDRSAISAAVDSALGALSEGQRDVLVLLPDASVRLLLMDFDTLPPERAEADAIVRFRLRKSLPFDVDTAALSFDVQRSAAGVKVLAAVCPSGVLADYESLFAECGYAPGFVLPSTLGTLGLIEAEGSAMLVKVENASASVAIVHRGDLVLVRTLETAATPELSVEHLAESIHPSVVFFEDTYGEKLERLLLTGGSAMTLAGSLQTEIGVPTSELAAGGHFGDTFGDQSPRGILTSVAGALLG